MTVFERLGRFTYRRRWWVLAAWALLVLLAIPFAPRAPGVLSPGGFSLADLESSRAESLLVQQLGAPPSALVLVYQSTGSARAGDPAFEAAVRTETAGVASAPYVRQVESHLLAPSQVSADRRVAYDVVLLDIAPDSSPAALPGIQAALRTAPGVSVSLAGGPAFYGDIQTVSESDLRRAELVSLPLAAVALVLVFGSLIAAGVPLVIGGAAVVTSLALIFVLASITPMSIFVLNLATLLLPPEPESAVAPRPPSASRSRPPGGLSSSPA